MVDKNEIKGLHAVFYSDGGSRGDDNNAGYGIHGYLYDVTDDPEAKRKKKRYYFTNYGYLTEIELNDQNKEVKTLEPKFMIDVTASLPNATNNYAELSACVNALDIVKENELQSLTLLADSKYVLDGVNKHLPRWKINGWKTSTGNTIQNLELWENIDKAYTNLKNNGVTFHLDWVKGHDGDPGNESADYLATLGVYRAKNNIHDYKCEISTFDKDYNKINIETNPLFTRTRWYFRAGTASPRQYYDGRYIYYTGSHGSTAYEEVGKMLVDASYAILILKSPETMIDIAQNLHNQLCNTDYANVVIGRLDRLYKDSVINTLTKHPESVITYDNGLGIECPDKEEITFEINPVRLSEVCMNGFEEVLGVYDNFINGNKNIYSVDVTDKFYINTVDKKNKPIVKISPDLDSSNSDVSVVSAVDIDGETKSFDITFTYGIDFPPKNKVKSAANENTKTYIVFWCSGGSTYRYAVIFDDGVDTSIWFSPFSNTMIFI